MKKFYAFAVAAVAAVSMNAQTLYVCGSGEGLEWTPGAPKEVVAANGAWTFDVANLVSMKVSLAYGEWDDFNTQAYCANVTEDLLGTPVEMALSDGNIDAPWTGDYHIVITCVDGIPGTITMTTTTAKPTGPKEIYVRGDMNGWVAEAEYLFTQSSSDENVYTIETSIESDITFKIADADWGSINYGYNDYVFGGSEDYWNYNNDNTIMGEDWEGIITITLSEVAKDPMLVAFSDPAGVSNVTVEANVAKEYYNLQGIRVANPENGLFIVRQGNKVTKVIK